MSLRIQIIVILVSAIALIFTIVMIKKEKLGIRIALPWLIVFVLIIIFAAIPSFMEWLANLIGIYAPLNMILFLAGIFIMAVIYSLMITVFSNRKKIRDLTQKMAYLEEQLKRNAESGKKEA